MLEQDYFDKIRQIIREEIREAILDVFKTFDELAKEEQKKRK